MKEEKKAEKKGSWKDLFADPKTLSMWIGIFLATTSSVVAHFTNSDDSHISYKVLKDRIVALEKVVRNNNEALIQQGQLTLDLSNEFDRIFVTNQSLLFTLAGHSDMSKETLKSYLMAARFVQEDELLMDELIEELEEEGAFEDEAEVESEAEKMSFHGDKKADSEETDVVPSVPSYELDTIRRKEKNRAQRKQEVQKIIPEKAPMMKDLPEAPWEQKKFYQLAD